MQKERNNQVEEIIVIEIKCFADKRTELHDFYAAGGQYMVYRNGLLSQNITNSVYLAMPTSAYHDFRNEPALQRTKQDAKMKLVIVDIDLEEVVQWIS